ncbi:hypothetical protein HAX54_023936, partial [Datura stramonium]|nr:hypothetical protein [Datura stramonium]
MIVGTSNNFVKKPKNLPEEKRPAAVDASESEDSSSSNSSHDKEGALYFSPL